jgi:hypothetical protein
VNHFSYSSTGFHKIYLAVADAHRENKSIFTHQECTRILTATMAAKSFSWKVIGITEAALKRFEELKFRTTKGHGISRAHLLPRIDTVRTILNRNQPFEPDEFMEFWINRDKTVFCLKSENKKIIPDYLPISNEDGNLFSCDGVLAGWRQKKPEQEFLRGFYDDFLEGKIKPISPPSPSTPQTA